jgi:hypothetical protein
MRSKSRLTKQHPIHASYADNILNLINLRLIYSKCIKGIYLQNKESTAPLRSVWYISLQQFAATYYNIVIIIIKSNNNNSKSCTTLQIHRCTKVKTDLFAPMPH